MRMSVQISIQQLVRNLISNIIIIIIYSVLIFFLLIKEATSSSASNNYSIAKSNCQEKCGNLSVPYPFGIGKECYRNKMFEVTCNKSTLFYLEDTQVFHISMDDVSIEGPAIVNCHRKSSGDQSSLEPISYWFTSELPFRVSHTKNKLVVIGCNIFAYAIDRGNKNYIRGCASLCYNTSKFINSSSANIYDNNYYNNNNSPFSCSGIGCCQTNIPDHISPFDLRIQNINTTESFWASKPCSVAFIAEKSFSEFKKFNPTGGSTDEEYILSGVPLVLDWAIGKNISCHQAQRRKDYACGRNSYCIDSIIDDGMGYRCHCSPGYQGNPYLKDGCQDIDECKDPKKNICPKSAICFNTAGKYSCKCKPGYHNIRGDEIGCIPNKVLAVHISLGIGITIGVLILIAIALWLYRKLEKRQRNKMKHKFFRKNGGLLLQQEISSSKGSAVKIKLFIPEELEKATDKFNESRILGKGGLGTVYKGMLSDGSIVAVKKSNVVDENQVGQFINEVIILSQINHRNIVKLLGCCLETEVPLLVYEHVSNGTLAHHLHDEGNASTITWNTRLRIAGQIAGALAYMHSYASTAIFHRDIKSSNILLDENYRAVLSDFGLSRSVPLNKTHLTTLVGGTFGYLDPEYFRSGQLTDKSDVYAFGVILAELLTGKEAVSSDKSDECLVLNFQSSMKQNHLFEILETLVVNEGKEEEIQVVANLAKRCLKMNARKRPTMKEVAAELDHLRRIQEQPLLKHNSQDSYCSVSGKSYSYTADAVEEESE